MVGRAGGGLRGLEFMSNVNIRLLGFHSLELHFMNIVVKMGFIIMTVRVR